MSVTLFLLLLVIAAIASGAHTLICGWVSKAFVCRLVAYAILLIFPALLPRLLGG